MMHNKRTSWIFVSILIALLAAGGLMAWAAPPDGGDNVAQTAAVPAASNSGGVTASVSVPASARRAADYRTAMDAELVGTAVVEGGPSYAVFQLASGTRFVREGDEIVGGVRLVQVGRNRIDVERDGVHQEIRMGSSEGSGKQVRPGSIHGPVTETDVQRLWDFRRQKVNGILEWVARHKG
jgi:hypothetical protein